VAPLQGKTEPLTAELERFGDDTELMAICLEVHRQLDIADQLRVMLGHVHPWFDAATAIALGPVEERGGWTLVDTTLPKRDPLLPIVGKLDAAAIRDAVTPGIEVHDGLGPVAKLDPPWPANTPGHTVVAALGGATGDVAGVMMMFVDRRPDPAAVARLEALMEAVAPAVANAEQVLAIRELVIRDDTAHCFNRRYFDGSLPDELSRAGRFHSPVSLIFLDMDNLKQVNKAHGHAMGSRTLREVSLRIQGKIRRFDKLFRFGGDEFCIVLPETEWHGALEVAERVRGAIAAENFLVDALPQQGGTPMTASLGIASYPLHARTEEELVEQADRAMQRIKNGTKNSIGIAESVGDDHGS
jgi:diguanylate cyclase (GGDEF)-like protein